MPVTGTWWPEYQTTTTSASSATTTWWYPAPTGGWATTINGTFQLTAAAATTTWNDSWYTPLRIPLTSPRQAEHAARRERARTARTAAVDRATRTLLELLDPTQRAQYEISRTFEVIGSEGGRYRIRPGSMGNVDWLDAGQAAGVLCAHPVLWTGEGHLPDPDVALAQLLALTTDEAEFVRTANVHRGRRPTHLALAA